MAVLDGQLRLAAGVVFHNWSPEFGLMEISAAAVSRRWATREVMREAFGYVFGTADCQMAIARCDEKNTAVRKLWSAFGAQEVIIPRLRGRMASEAVLTLTDDAWAQSRFMRPHLVQE